MFATHEQVEELRKDFVKGTRVRLISMDGEPYGPQPGDYGTVRCVDDIGTIHVMWDSGHTQGVLFNVDKVEKVETA